jgi:hypothetical protein
MGTCAILPEFVVFLNGTTCYTPRLHGLAHCSLVADMYQHSAVLTLETMETPVFVSIRISNQKKRCSEKC